MERGCLLLVVFLSVLTVALVAGLVIVAKGQILKVSYHQTYGNLFLDIRWSSGHCNLVLVIVIVWTGLCYF